ncbi:hypothetical protein PFICI_12561 [Pestalotiopsis fici W106-1]|uniref:Zn(2)-C6 fungal-type domain-containing protein n=1 Tax=Pestalotiopsis fici (strain W106-1 / CGMCC3.15140) TaxID=1229662 RepID=W3WR32_PESFW|nr:uncharacterized protein PFICI_12561 [Pestalotiopsis fici W106-1]ETS75617.1 hypothetical protein PFICI_12561 [Pestalotiopsis fici W106-1]
MEPPAGSSGRRRRTEYGKRSKQGCRTCISKKVKCDECHPRCGRCIRLDLCCEWAGIESPLAVRRRGHGPIKDRDNWQPAIISPKPQTSVDQQQHSQDGRAMSVNLPDSHNTLVPVSGRTETPSSESLMPCELPNLLAAQGAGSEQTVRSSTYANRDDDLISGNSFVVERRSALSLRQNSLPQLPSSTCLHPSLQPPMFTFSRVPAMIESSDVQAVAFHRGVFAPLKSTRASAESAHSIFLDHAIQNDMALHFLLAVSHSELAIYRGECVRAPPESWLHFRHGSQLLSNHRNELARPNHVATLLSFLYMYIFWMRRGPFDKSMLRELSRSVLLHVKTYNLDNLCAASTRIGSDATSMPDNVVISRILTYLYDRDGFCYFFGCGGAFASYVSDNHEKRSRIWRLSQMGYPWSTDPGPAASSTTHGACFEDGRITEVYFQLIAIHHDINRYSQAREASGLEIKIRIHLEHLEKEQRSLFKMVDECERRASTPCLMALVTVSFYHALVIYLHRGRESPFSGRPVPNGIQLALGKLVSTAYYTVASGPVQLLERFQWALLIAGIETNDPVHRDWVRGNIADPSMKSTLETILDAQQTRPVSMREIRQLVSGVNVST